MGFRMHCRRARADRARSERGAEGYSRTVGWCEASGGPWRRFAFGGTLVPALLLIAAGAAPQPAPAPDQRPPTETGGPSPGTPVDPQSHPDKIVTAANQLRQLFLDSGYQPGSVVTNAQMADGTILVFQGQDADKHTTVLRLANAPAPAKGSKTEGPGGSVALSLSYTLDSRSPDIFRLKKGQF